MYVRGWHACVPLLPQRKVPVEHDATRAVVSALQQLLVVVRKLDRSPSCPGSYPVALSLIGSPPPGGESLFPRAQAWEKRSCAYRVDSETHKRS